MDEFELKEVMNQIHISEEMQEEIIMNIQNRVGNRPHKTRNLKKAVIGAAAFILIAGAVSVPVQAFVSNIVKARMESIPTEEVREINDMVQSKPTEADTFSREYSESEEERNKELWQAYKDGTFPENVIAQVDNEEDVPEGTVCYVRSTGVFNLPEQEMTDEEMLEIIDFQHKMSYAVSQGPALQADVDTAYTQGWTQEKIDEANRRDRAILEEKVKAAGGISEDEAIEIARKAMEADLGEKAKELEVIIYPDVASYGWKLELFDITDWDEYKDKGDIAYSVTFGNAEEVEDPKDFCNYKCFVNAVDGSICGAYSLSGDLGPYWDSDDLVWYEH